MAYQSAPRQLPAFPNAQVAKAKTGFAGGRRRRWKDYGSRVIYEWDAQHGAVEAYDWNGNHLGQFDAYTGQRQKDPDPTRKIDP
jgi:hypothetical protein